MEKYFISKKICSVILENLNDNFVKSLLLSKENINYDDENKELIQNIINMINQYLSIYNNDLLYSLNTKNKSYYLTLEKNMMKCILHFINDNHDKSFILDLLKYSDVSYKNEYLFNANF